MTAPIRALVVEDDDRLARFTKEYLEQRGVLVTHVRDGDRAIAEQARSVFDIVVLDVMLPGQDGFDVCRTLRKRTSIPIIVVTARTEETDRVLGLELGADDYLAKPFSPRELLARIRALLRRSRTHETLADSLARIRSYRFAGWQLNVRLRRLISRQGQTIPITNSEL